MLLHMLYLEHNRPQPAVRSAGGFFIYMKRNIIIDGENLRKISKLDPEQLTDTLNDFIKVLMFLLRSV